MTFILYMVYNYHIHIGKQVLLRDKPQFYQNKLLEAVKMRHEEAVKVLSFLFGNNFSSDKIWEHLENYFLGILPKELE